MASKIFISYRRDDDPAAAARVRDGLAAKFGKTNLFMDVDDLLAGLRFDEELAKALAACDVFIAIIGARWMDLLRAKAASGERDYVRAEIAEALKRKIVFIPARVGRDGHLPPLPRAEDLPAEIRDLVLYQKHDVTHEYFGRDVAALAEAITAVRHRLRPEPVRAMPRLPWGWIGATTLSVLAITYVGAYYAGMPVPWPGASPAVEADSRRDPALSVTPGSAQSFRDRLADGKSCPMCPEMVVVPAGQFTMGSPANEPERESLQQGTESPQLKVTIARLFAVSKFAVTRGEFAAFVTDTGHKTDGGCTSWSGTEPLEWKQQSDRSWRSVGFAQDDRHPVVCVNWDDAKAYAAWLSRKTGKSYRLLSEAEREYVTRAGTTTPFWWGSSITTKQANYADPSQGGGSKGEYRQRTVPVDSFEANQWGLYNVHGNIFEWTEDCWNDSNSGNPGNGSARTTGECGQRVVRGGSWGNSRHLLRAAVRSGETSDYRTYGLGFRLARTLDH